WPLVRLRHLIFCETSELLARRIGFRQPDLAFGEVSPRDHKVRSTYSLTYPSGATSQLDDVSIAVSSEKSLCPIQVSFPADMGDFFVHLPDLRHQRSIRVPPLVLKVLDFWRCLIGASNRFSGRYAGQLS